MTFVDFGMDFDVVVDIDINVFKYDLLLLMLMKMLKSRSSRMKGKKYFFRTLSKIGDLPPSLLYI